MFLQSKFDTYFSGNDGDKVGFNDFTKTTMTKPKKKGNPVVSGIMAAANLLIHTIPRMKIEFKFKSVRLFRLNIICT